jgi:hypothetical protein
MRIRTSVFLFAIACSTSAIAADERESLIEGIYAIHSIDAMYAPLSEKTKDELRSQFTAMAVSAIPSLSDPGNEEDKKIFQKYVDEFVDFSPSKDAEILWKKMYANNLSTEELRIILAYYQSSAGKKDIANESAASNAANAVVMEKFGAHMAKALEALVAELKARKRK